MVRQIAPVFFTMDIPATLAYYTGKLGFACLGTWQDPPVYAIVARDQQVIQSGLFPLRAPSRARTRPLRRAAHRQSGQIRGRIARRLPVR
jgi:hypothetical protein